MSGVFNPVLYDVRREFEMEIYALSKQPTNPIPQALLDFDDTTPLLDFDNTTPLTDIPST